MATAPRLQPGTRRVLWLAAAALAGAALTAGPPAARAAGGHPGASQDPGSPQAATVKSVSQVPVLPGVSAGTVTLITGDRIGLAPGPSAGRMLISERTAPRVAGPALAPVVEEIAKPGHDPVITALPADAAAEVHAGRLDQSLFNIGDLTAAGDNGPGAAIPVVLQFAGHPGAAGLKQLAARLPGVTLTATDTAASTATVKLAVAKATAFWAALTGHQPVTLRAPAQPGGQLTAPPLAGDVTKAWLAGPASDAAQTRRPAPAQVAMPTYTVTETIHGPANQGTNPANWCYPGWPGQGGGMTICGFSPPLQLLGIAGAGADTAYDESSETCLDVNPCDTIQVQYQVPAGTYALMDNYAWYAAGGHFKLGAIEDPQFTVAGDTALAFDLASARQLQVQTPLPAQLQQAWLYEDRTLPDGTAADTTFGFPYGWGAWVDSAPTRATIGSYDFRTTWVLTQPTVNAHVAGPQAMTLDALYPGENHIYGWPQQTYGSSIFPGPSVRFSGTHTYQVVDAGGGTHYAGLDLKGKLALIHLDLVSNLNLISNSWVTEDQLNGALKAGAAGVIVDPDLPPEEFPGFREDGAVFPLPVTPNWWTFGLPQPQIPFVSIPHSQADTLRALLKHGPVSVTVADTGPSPYEYALDFNEQGQIPGGAGPLHLTVTSAQLATVTVHEHADPGQPAGAGTGDAYTAYPTNSSLFAALLGAEFPVPSTHRVYLTTSPDLVQFLGGVRQIDAAGDTTFSQDLQVAGRPGQTLSQDWFDPPQTPGAPEAPADVFAAQPGQWNGSAHFRDYAWCTFCRQGNTFYPLFTRTSGATPRLEGDVNFYTDPSSIHLYANGQEIPPDSSNGFGFVTYQLPAASARYRLAASDGITSDTWDFTSAEPTTDSRPEGTRCINDLMNFPNPPPPCTAPPLILLNYDAGLGLNNTVTAPGMHTLQITAYHQDPKAPAITSLKAWTSTNGGKTWQQARVSRGRGGSYTALYSVPPLASTNDAVSLKVQSSDAAGNDITQVIPNAYGLAAAPR